MLFDPISFSIIVSFLCMLKFSTILCHSYSQFINLPTKYFFSSQHIHSRLVFLLLLYTTDNNKMREYSQFQFLLNFHGLISKNNTYLLHDHGQSMNLASRSVSSSIASVSSLCPRSLALSE